MSEAIMLKQFDGSTVTPKDDAIMYDSFSCETGLLEGCDLTHTGAGQIRIGAGRGIIKGRQFVVQEHTINVTLSNDSDMSGRVYIRMELSDTSDPVKILHVTAAVLPEMEQNENCNNDNGVYEIELGTYTASKLTIGNLEKTIKQISPKLAKSMVVDTPEDVAAVTEQGYPVGCKALNGLLGGIRFGVDEEGNYGYIKAGADTVTPFRSGVQILKFDPAWVLVSTSINRDVSAVANGSVINLANAYSNGSGTTGRFSATFRTTEKYPYHNCAAISCLVTVNSSTSESFGVDVSYGSAKFISKEVYQTTETVSIIYDDVVMQNEDDGYIYLTVQSAIHTYGYPSTTVSYNVRDFKIIY